MGSSDRSDLYAKIDARKRITLNACMLSHIGVKPGDIVRIHVSPYGQAVYIRKPAEDPDQGRF